MNSERSPGTLPPLRIQPDNIDFGCLKSGETAKVTLKVSGGPGKVLIHNDQLRVEPSSFDKESCELQVMLLAGSAGELIWDNIVLQRDSDELKVLVTAHWEEYPLVVDSGGEEDKPPSPKEANAEEKPPALEERGMEEKLPSLKEIKIEEQYTSRQYKGRRCSKCGKNFAYDVDTSQWEQCTCAWYDILVNVGSYIIGELRVGIREFPSFAKESWNIILGKEKW